MNRKWPLTGSGNSVRTMSSSVYLLLTVSLLACSSPWCHASVHWRRSASTNNGGGGTSLTERLLSLWTGGGGGDTGSDGAGSSEGGVGGGAGTAGSGDKDSFKKVLDFLSNQAAASSDHKSGVPSSALRGLQALTSGGGRTPTPIDLSRDEPTAAVIKYLDELGINERECRLLTVCQLLTEPQASYGVFGELINYVFGSESGSVSGRGVLNATTYRDFYEAAQNGRRMNDCSRVYSKCNTSYIEYIKLVNI